MPPEQPAFAYASGCRVPESTQGIGRRASDLDTASLLNVTVETTRVRGHLSGEHFGVDDTLIQAWVGHKSFVPRTGSERIG